jgi:hypothetical protein
VIFGETAILPFRRREVQVAGSRLEVAGWGGGAVDRGTMARSLIS